MNYERIQELQARIADLKKRWPAHSVPPALLQELDDLEDDLAAELNKAGQEDAHA